MKLRAAVILAVSAVLLSTSAIAQHRGGHGGHHGGHHGGGWGGGSRWIVPAVISGVAVYALTRPTYYTPPPVVYTQPTYVYPQQTYIQQEPIYVPRCSEWRETQDAYGTIHRERTCY
jgi:hypothetical protein